MWLDSKKNDFLCFLLGGDGELTLPSDSDSDGDDDDDDDVHLHQLHGQPFIASLFAFDQTTARWKTRRDDEPTA